MRTDAETYRQELLLALRLRDLPGPHIAEALAELDSHLAETGEDPRQAFGPPREYAAQVAGARGGSGRPGLRGVLAAVRPAEVVIALLALAGGWLLADGVFAAGADRDSSIGLVGGASCALGVALLLATSALVRRTSRERDDRVRHPVTGADLAGRAPSWVPVVAVGGPVLALLISYLAGVLQR